MMRGHGSSVRDVWSGAARKPGRMSEQRFWVMGWELVALAALLLAAAAPAQPGVTERASVSSSGDQADDASQKPSISADGRYIAFESYASNLVADDLYGYCDIFVRDKQTGATERVSVSSAGEEADNQSGECAISADGRYVAFESVASNLVPGHTGYYWDIFVRDRLTGTTDLVSVSTSGDQGDDDSYGPAISADGRYVAFYAVASNLVAGDTNGVLDVFVRDRLAGTTERVSVSSSGEEGDDQSGSSCISADGRYVAFSSDATNLVPGDTNNQDDIFVRDRLAGTTVRASISSSGEEADGVSRFPSITADGRYVAFQCNGTNLVPDDTNYGSDVFVHDLLGGTTERVSVSSCGGEANDGCSLASISPDGRYVTFYSIASNLVQGDTNECADVFIHDRLSGITERVSVSSAGE
jgi:Tol biopolymer transport system component